MNPAIEQKPSGSRPERRWARPIFGASGIVCLLVSFFWIAASGWEEVTNPYIAALIRCGLVLIALWLALPDLRSVSRHVPYMMIVAMMILLVVIVARPRLLPIMAVIVVAILAINVTTRMFQSKSH